MASTFSEITSHTMLAHICERDINPWGRHPVLTGGRFFFFVLKFVHRTQFPEIEIAILKRDFDAYFGNVSGLLLNNPGDLVHLPLYNAFSSPELISFGIVAHVTTSATALFDIFLDFLSRRKVRSDEELEEGPDCLLERLLVISTNICTGIVFLSLRESKNAPYIYMCMYAVHCIAGIGAVLLICNKLAPSNFTQRRIFVTYVCFCLTQANMAIGVGHDILYWANIFIFVSLVIFFWLFLGKMLVPWLLSLKARNLVDSPITVNEMSCLWYSLSTLLLKFMVPGVFFLCKAFQWSQFTAVEIYVFVYSAALLGAIVCNVPGRLARSVVDSERRRLVDVKRGIIRYLSHEVRSPLNIIFSAIGFLEVDVNALPPSPALAAVCESLSTVRQASQDILQTMNEMLQMETINSGSLSLDPQMVP
eukprot:gene24360-31707_t